MTHNKTKTTFYKDKNTKNKAKRQNKKSEFIYFGDLKQYKTIFASTISYKKHIREHEKQFGKFNRHSKNCTDCNDYVCTTKFNRYPIFRHCGKTKVECRGVKCKSCSEIFYIIPSFILPNKHYATEIVADTLELRHLNQDTER